MRITGTFLDEISMDIPHQNWGRKEWDRDFAAMKAIGIETVILIRCGHKQWMAYPSKVLRRMQGCFEPPEDLVRMFLDLSEEHDMAFYFGIYESGEYWWQKQYQKELDISLRVADEAWEIYGCSPAFKGWYNTWEVSRGSLGMVDMFHRMGKHCKDLSGSLPVLISPYIEGVKSTMSEDSITPEQHEREWNEIMGGIRGAVDIVAFQDGHVDFHELSEFLQINHDLACKHGLQCWTNTETFDRDMPNKIPPDQVGEASPKAKRRRKSGLHQCNNIRVFTFISPNSCYPQAHHLYDRYCEHFALRNPAGRNLG